METGELLRTLQGHSGWVQSVAISHDGQFIASGSNDKTIKIWSWETGKLLTTFTGHLGSVNSVAFSPDRLFLVSGSDDKTVKIWGCDS